MIFFLSIVTLLCTFTRGESSYTFCNEIESKSSLLKLKRYLFCEYDQSVRPTSSHKNPTNVEFGLIPKFIEVGGDDDVINVHCWTILSWKDVHLTWDPSEFSDVNSLHVSSDEVWVPDITVHNAGNDVSDEFMPYTNCWMSNAGTVKCVQTTVYTTRCAAIQSWWPYDILNCTIEFASWSHSDEELEYSLIHGGLLIKEFQQNLEWHLEHSYVTERVETYKFSSNLTSHFMYAHFVLKRHAGILYVSTVMPIIVLMVMTLMALWLDPKSMERMVVANLNFVCHLLCIENLHWQVRTGGMNTLKILIFYEISFGLATFTLILTSLLRHLQELTAETPTWIVTGTSAILNNRIGQILLLSILDPKASAGLEAEAEDNANLVRSNKQGVSWKYAAIFIGWLAFFSVLVAYVIMLILYFPTESAAISYLDNFK